MFERDAPTGQKNSRAYSQRNIYYRRDGESKPAETADELRFLCGANRKFGRRHTTPRTVIHNLGPQDPTLIQFVGRRHYLEELARWHCDRYSLVRLLSGYGGLGKTTIARKHVEQLIEDPPFHLVAVIWLTAKQRFFDALANEHVSNREIEFSDLRTLLVGILRALLVDDKGIDEGASVQQLAQQVAEELCSCPALVVVDDIDSLDDQEQRTVYHELEQICSRSIQSTKAPSRILLTARHDLGAPPSQLIRVTGMDEDEFFGFVQVTTTAAGVKWPIGAGSKQMQRFRQAADGSPLFASGIIRLMRLGHTLDTALSKWKGKEGETVREFAFEKEVDRLSDSSVRTLFTLAELGDASQIELKQVTQSTAVGLASDLEELRKI